MRLFITSSGTDIGKTFVTSLLVRQLLHAGRQVMAYKPIISGFDAAQPEASDTAALLDALGLPLTQSNIAQVSPYRFSAPLSPHAAALREGKRINVPMLVAQCRMLDPQPDVTFVEGVGGVMVPINERETVLDWLSGMNIPALLVVGSYVGSISHSLTAMQVLGHAGVPVQAVIVSESTGSAMPLTETVATLRQFLPNVPHIVPLPRVHAWQEAPDLLHILYEAAD